MEEQLKQSIFLHLCNNLKKELLQPFILKNKLEKILIQRIGFIYMLEM